MTMHADSATTSRNAVLRGRLALASALTVLATTWLVLLPWLATTKPVADHIAAQQRQGIDPSAMFYTELDIAPAIAHRAERRFATTDLTFTSP
jgi:hypothetical protein